MKPLEIARNLVESNQTIGSIYSKIGNIPIYRNYVNRKIRDRIRYIQTNRSYEIMIEVSSLCNARCHFCPNTTMKRKKGVMTDEIFYLIFDRLQQEKINPPLFVLYHSGEPLVDRKLFEKVRFIKNRFPQSKVGFATNFELANEDIINEILESGIDALRISLNAAKKETYQKIMHTDYDRTLKNVDQLIEKRNRLGSKKPSIRVSMVKCSENDGEEEQFVKRWSKADTVYIQRPMDWGGAVTIKSQYSQEQKLFPCMQLFERMVILNNGDYSICCVDFEGEVHKNIKEHKLLDTFYSDPFDSMRKIHLDGDIKSLPLCANCISAHSIGMSWLIKNLFPSSYVI